MSSLLRTLGMYQPEVKTLPPNVADAFNRWGVNPDEFVVADTSNDPLRSGYANLTSGLFDSLMGDETRRKVLAIPMEGNDFVKRHELSHASTPFGRLVDNLPVAVAGNVAAQAGMGMGLFTVANEIRDQVLNATGAPALQSPLLQAMGPEKYRKFMTAVIGGTGAAYAPRLVEETTANIRALKDTWDMDGGSGLWEALPSAALSQGSYMLPALGLAAALYRVRNPRAAVVPKHNLLQRLQASADKMLGGLHLNLAG